MAPSIPKVCKNDSCTYTGREHSPLGLGLSAAPMKVGDQATGKDKNEWIVVDKKGINIWKKIEETKPVVSPKKAAPVSAKSNPVPEIEEVMSDIDEEEVTAPPAPKVKKTKPKAEPKVKKAKKEATVAPKVKPVKEKRTRTPTEYNIFVGTKMREIRESQPGLPATEYMQIAVKAWNLHKVENGIEAKPRTKPVKAEGRKPTAYNLFIGEKLRSLRTEQPGLQQKEYMKLAVEIWNEQKAEAK